MASEDPDSLHGEANLCDNQLIVQPDQTHNSQSNNGTFFGTTFGPIFGTTFSSTLGSAYSLTCDVLGKTVTQIGDAYVTHVPASVRMASSGAVEAVTDITVASVKSAVSKYSEQFDRSIKPLIRDSASNYLSTHELIRSVLESIPDRSRILDVGIGTALAYCKNAELIKEKQLDITGIDVNMPYILKAKHNMIDYNLENELNLINVGDYEIDKQLFNCEHFDYIIFSESYSTISNVNNVLIYFEDFLKETGSMIVVSVLFDQYTYMVDMIKQNLKYVSSVEFGQMMLMSDLDEHIRSRGITTYDTKLIQSITLGSIVINCYAVLWNWKIDP